MLAGWTGPNYIGRENPWLELVARGILFARPGGHCLLAAFQVGFGKGAWSLTEDNNEVLHFGFRLGVDGGNRGRSLGVSGGKSDAKHCERAREETKRGDCPGSEGELYFTRSGFGIAIFNQRARRRDRSSSQTAARARGSVIKAKNGELFSHGHRITQRAKADL